MSAVMSPSVVTLYGKPVAAWHFGQAIGKRQSFTSMKCLAKSPSEHIAGANNVFTSTVRRVGLRRLTANRDRQIVKVREGDELARSL
jgi:hypothetical protein